LLEDISPFPTGMQKTDVLLLEGFGAVGDEMTWKDLQPRMKKSQ
jgi:hypothetical protein